MYIIYILFKMSKMISNCLITENHDYHSQVRRKRAKKNILTPLIRFINSSLRKANKHELFIHGKNVFMPHLLLLFNKIFDKGYFPESWSDGFIILLHKKGTINDVNNYRGVTLLSSLGKLFTHILNNYMCNWAESYHVYIEA